MYLLYQFDFIDSESESEFLFLIHRRLLSRVQLSAMGTVWNRKEKNNWEVTQRDSMRIPAN